MTLRDSRIYLFLRSFSFSIKCKIFGTLYAYLQARAFFFFSSKTRVELFAGLFRVIGTRLANTLVFMNPRTRPRDMYARSATRFTNRFQRGRSRLRGNYFPVVLVHEAL